MKIGLVRRGFSASGGAESYLRGFAQAAVEAEHEVVLFASPEWKTWEFGEKIIVQGKSPRAFSDSLEALKPREKCDAVFSLERVSSCDVYRAGDGVHAAWLRKRGEISSPFRRFGFRLNPKHTALINLEKKVMSSARSIIANSEMVKNEIAEFHGVSIAAKVTIVRNGIDVNKWAIPTIPRSEIRKRTGISEDARVAVFVGSGWERKGLHSAIEACRLAKCLLLVSGKGSLSNVPSHVRLLGPTSDVVSVLHASDAFILPTLYDPFSNATLEALAAGLPIITTKSNGVSEILNPVSDGTVVESFRDVDAMGAALNTWISDERLLLRRAHASRYTLQSNFAEILHIITS